MTGSICVGLFSGVNRFFRLVARRGALGVGVLRHYHVTPRRGNTKSAQRCHMPQLEIPVCVFCLVCLASLVQIISGACALTPLLFMCTAQHCPSNDFFA
jgi:hypothetical protein